MDIAVCIKRVPLSPGRWTLTADGTEFLGYARQIVEQVALLATEVVEQAAGAGDLVFLRLHIPGG